MMKSLFSKQIHQLLQPHFI